MKGGELLSRQIKWTFINPSQIDQILDFNVRMKSKEMLQMDYAVFAVHAHESRLSINEDNAGIGYAKIYRALLKATGESKRSSW